MAELAATITSNAQVVYDELRGCDGLRSNIEPGRDPNWVLDLAGSVALAAGAGEIRYVTVSVEGDPDAFQVSGSAFTDGEVLTFEVKDLTKRRDRGNGHVAVRRLDDVVSYSVWTEDPDVGASSFPGYPKVTLRFRDGTTVATSPAGLTYPPIGKYREFVMDLMLVLSTSRDGAAARA